MDQEVRAGKYSRDYDNLLDLEKKWPLEGEVLHHLAKRIDAEIIYHIKIFQYLND